MRRRKRCLFMENGLRGEWKLGTLPKGPESPSRARCLSVGAVDFGRRTVEWMTFALFSTSRETRLCSVSGVGGLMYFESSQAHLREGHRAALLVDMGVYNLLQM